MRGTDFSDALSVFIGRKFLRRSGLFDGVMANAEAVMSNSADPAGARADALHRARKCRDRGHYAEARRWTRVADQVARMTGLPSEDKKGRSYGHL